MASVTINEREKRGVIDIEQVQTEAQAVINYLRGQMIAKDDQIANLVAVLAWRDKQIAVLESQVALPAPPKEPLPLDE